MRPYKRHERFQLRHEHALLFKLQVRRMKRSEIPFAGKSTTGVKIQKIVFPGAFEDRGSEYHPHSAADQDSEIVTQISGIAGAAHSCPSAVGPVGCRPSWPPRAGRR